MPTNTHPDLSLEVPSKSTIDSPSHILLQVGDRRFLTTRETLAGAEGYFAALFAGRWSTSKDHERIHTTPDGIRTIYHFIDRDGDLFCHILQYLRWECFRSSTMLRRDTITYCLQNF